MKAMVYRKHGEPRDVLKLEEIDKPVPNADEVIIRVLTASVNPLDSHFMTTNVGRIMSRILRRRRDPVPGVDVSGEVDAVGADVTDFKPGDAVFGSCEGAFAEYARAKQSKLAFKPDNVSHTQAAAVPVAGLTALQGLRGACKLQAGEKIVITGAAGGVGTFAVQIAKMLGAEVTAVSSASSAGLVRRIGADRVIDYVTADFTRSGYQHDVIFDLVGDRSISDYCRALTARGRYVGAGILGQGPPGLRTIVGMLSPLVLAPFKTQGITSFVAKMDAGDLAHLAGLIASGEINPVIDRTYPLAEAAEAIQYVREKHAHGKVVITVH